MASVTLSKIDKSGGRVDFQFADGSGLGFKSAADAADYARRYLTGDTLRAIVVALALTRQPTLGNVAALEGKTVTIDFSQANWGTVG